MSHRFYKSFHLNWYTMNISFTFLKRVCHFGLEMANINVMITRLYPNIQIVIIIVIIECSVHRMPLWPSGNVNGMLEYVSMPEISDMMIINDDECSIHHLFVVISDDCKINIKLMGWKKNSTICNDRWINDALSRKKTYFILHFKYQMDETLIWNESLPYSLTLGIFYHTAEKRA